MPFTKMENQPQIKNTYRKIEIALFFLSIALLVFVYSFAVANKKIVQADVLRAKQVSSLVSELGEVREENVLLKNSLKNQTENLDTLARMLKEAEANWNEKTEKTPPHVTVNQEKDDKSVILMAQPAKSLPEKFINILIAGHHQKLTDTIMVVSLNFEKQKITVFSLPRDFFVGGRKINEYYFLYGIPELMKQVNKVTGLTIDHYAVLSMAAFEKFIDGIGGVDVDVKKPLYDAFFPTEDDQYQVYNIASGQHHFDGAQALKYSRSRSSTSDFDRAQRQQQIFSAVFTKVRSMNLLQNLALAKTIYESVGSLFETDLGMLDALLFLQKFTGAEIKTGNVFSTSNLLNPSRNLKGQYILMPQGGDFSRIHEFVNSTVSF